MAVDSKVTECAFDEPLLFTGSTAKESGCFIGQSSLIRRLTKTTT